MRNTCGVGYVTRWAAVLLFLICIAGITGCSRGGGSEFGRPLWVGHHGFGGIRLEDQTELMRFSNCTSRVVPTDVMRIWESCMKMVPSFDPVCISETESYYVVSGGEPPRGSIWNSGYLLVRKSDGWIWNQVAGKWVGVGFTALREEEIRQMITTDRDLFYVLDKLGPPFQEHPEDSQGVVVFMYLGHRDAAYDILVDVHTQTGRVTGVRAGGYGRL